jgi:hypothetical protein
MRSAVRSTTQDRDGMDRAAAGVWWRWGGWVVLALVAIRAKSVDTTCMHPVNVAACERLSNSAPQLSPTAMRIIRLRILRVRIMRVGR